MESSKTHSSRREFVKTATAGAAAFSIMKTGTALGSAANSSVTLGLIGCGGRSTHDTRIFLRDPGVRVTAICDIFEDRLGSIKKNLNLNGPREFKNHGDLLATDVDAVLIATPVYLHPEHFEAAVEARKHIFLEKPAGADVAGCQRVIRAAEKADPRKNIAVGFQQRYSALYREAERRVRNGEIGSLHFARSNWIITGAAATKVKSPFPPEQQKIRHWAWWRETSGDIIVEQDCHGVDILNWFCGGLPRKAWGQGGRAMRANGDCLDHLNVTYEYTPKLRAVLAATHIGPRSFRKVSEEFYGTTGVIEVSREFVVHFRPPEGKAQTSSKPYPFGHYYRDLEQLEVQKPKYDMTIDAVEEFLARVREGRPENVAARAAESTLACVLGRMAIDSGREVTWEEMLKQG